MDIDYNKKLEICCEQMALDFGISEKQAKNIISSLDLYDIVFEYYEDYINEYFEQKELEDNEDINNNHDLYKEISMGVFNYGIEIKNKTGTIIGKRRQKRD